MPALRGFYLRSGGPCTRPTRKNAERVAGSQIFAAKAGQIVATARMPAFTYGETEGSFLSLKPDMNKTADFVWSTAVAALGVDASELVRFDPKVDRNRAI